MRTKERPKRKICSKCGEEKDVATEFYAAGKGLDYPRPECKECSKSFRSQTPERARQRSKEVRDRNRQFLYDYYLEHPCVDCGEDDPIVLQSDHIKGDKIKKVSAIVHDTYSLKRIQAELDKCVTRCANCHFRRHASEFGWYARLDLEVS